MTRRAKRASGVPYPRIVGGVLVWLAYASVSVLGLKQSQRCSAEDVQVKKRGPIFDIVQVELDAFLDFCFIVDLTAPTVNLRPPGDAGLDAMACEIAIDRLVEQSVLQFALHRVRARPDQRQIAFEHNV